MSDNRYQQAAIDLLKYYNDGGTAACGELEALWDHLVDDRLAVKVPRTALTPYGGHVLVDHPLYTKVCEYLQKKINEAEIALGAAQMAVNSHSSSLSSLKAQLKSIK